MNDNSYHMPVWIGIGIRTSISKIFLVSKVLEESGIGPPFSIDTISYVADLI